MQQLIVPSGRLVGAQRPRIRTVPPSLSTAAAREAIDLAASVDIDLDPWQRYALEDTLGEREDGRWASFENAIVVARQNGKGKIIEVRELAGLILFSELLLLHTSHEVKTNTEAFIRTKDLFTNYDDLRREVRRVNNSHGEEGIELLNGARLRFIARSRVSARGFSGECLILDEAFCLTDGAMSSIFPTMAAQDNPQIWYTSSAVNQRHHNYGHVLARVRKRGMSGSSKRLSYLEWSPRADVDRMNPAERAALRADRSVWAQTNPGLGYRISEEYIESELDALDPLDFDVERLGIGDWPSDEAETWEVVSENDWTVLADPTSTVLDPVAMSLDCTPDHTWTSIAAAGRRPDGMIHIEVVEHRTGTAWVPERAAELDRRHNPCVFVVDEHGPAGSLIPALERAGIKVTRLASREVASGCDHFLDMIRHRGVRHRGQLELSTGLAGAKKRVIGDARQWTWARRGIHVVISPVVAVTQAAYGFEVHGSVSVFFGGWR